MATEESQISALVNLETLRFTQNDNSKISGGVLAVWREWQKGMQYSL